MTLEALSEAPFDLPLGEARFVRPSELKSILLRSEDDGYLTVDVPEIRASIRGRLAWLLEEAIELSLELRGASRSGLSTSANPELNLTDQLYRARLLGARGLLIALPSLEAITNRRGALDADDSATLRWWFTSARQRPVRFYLALTDCMLGAYLEPVTLTELLAVAVAPAAPSAAPPVVVEWVDPDAASDGDRREALRSPLPLDPRDPSPISDVIASERAEKPFSDQPTMAFDDPVMERAQPSVAQQFDDASSGQRLQLASDRDAEPPPSAQFGALETPTCDGPMDDARDVEVEPAPISDPPDTSLECVTFDPCIVPPPRLSPIDADAILSVGADPEHNDGSLTPMAAPAADDLALASSGTHEIPLRDPSLPDRYVELTAPRHEIRPIPHPPTILLSDGEPLVDPATVQTAPPPSPLAAELACEQKPPVTPLNVDAPNAWRAWMQRLESARGPKPLNAIEQLFIQAYVPLMDAWQRGIAGDEARPILERWSTNFRKSYVEAFDALRVRTRRPMMVLDVPDAALRLARLHGARSVQLLLVDGMRFDLGLRVEAQLVSQLGQAATLTDRFLLWSALPTTSACQLELIARGPDGLRDSSNPSDTPVVVARGRAATTLRRIRAGNRELFKLDLVEARLGEPGERTAERLDQLGVELSEVLAAAISRFPPRTLVALFGDHGFCLDDQEHGTSAMRQGGASPEEVLVPGFAWLVGQTH